MWSEPCTGAAYCNAAHLFPTMSTTHPLPRSQTTNQWTNNTKCVPGQSAVTACPAILDSVHCIAAVPAQANNFHFALVQ